ncbi:helix-turn-helix transcriptional regulator [Brevundimonas sp. AJA228-03]|uniref:winged helix-turn-helix transcriptional regulator n=1 Tax=Brevundimonas sp. AJA228-03 TaxID=2752515 RepID=UPI001AE01903|nr:helix-turn-helix domain-containing protein [Brevundimonas sp. AJA228-03]QTN18273.1 helix-turn-helix transcriptional regulator [Brevundimonas sp. AJA228-03]
MLPITVQAEEESGLCPVRAILVTVTGKWSSLILLALEDGPQRFSAIKRLIGDISQRVLTENLRALERDGYVRREVVPGSPIEVRYQLTPMGGDLLSRIIPLVTWATNHHAAVQAARNRYDADERVS